MTEIAGRGVCFVGEGKLFFDPIKKSFTLPYTDCHLEPIVSFLTTNRIIRVSVSHSLLHTSQQTVLGYIPTSE